MATAYPEITKFQARSLVVALALFWGSWGVVVGLLSLATTVGAVGLLVCMGFGFWFFWVYASVWSLVAQVPTWRLLLGSWGTMGIRFRINKE